MPMYTVRMHHDGGHIHISTYSDTPEGAKALVCKAEMAPPRSAVAVWEPIEWKDDTASFMLAVSNSGRGKPHLIDPNRGEILCGFRFRGAASAHAILGVADLPDTVCEKCVAAAKHCRWFALCRNEAEAMVDHPVIGGVPTCGPHMQWIAEH